MHLLLGVPLIQYSIDTLLRSQLIDTILVSSDSEEVESFCKKYENIVFRKRSEDLALSHSSTLEVVKDILTVSDFRRFEITMVLQVTSPNRTLENIENSLMLLMKHPHANSVVSISELRHQYRPEKLGLLTDGEMRSVANSEYIFQPNLYSPRSLYYRNGAIYMGRTSAILSQNSLLPKPVLGYVMERSESVDIDYPEDFAVAEFFLRDRPEL